MHRPSRRTCLQVCPACRGPPGPSGVAWALGGLAEALASVWGVVARGGQGGPCGWTPHPVLGLALPAWELCPHSALWAPGMLPLPGGPGPGGRAPLTLSARQAGRGLRVVSEKNSSFRGGFLACSVGALSRQSVVISPPLSGPDINSLPSPAVPDSRPAQRLWECQQGRPGEGAQRLFCAARPFLQGPELPGAGLAETCLLL